MDTRQRFPRWMTSLVTKKWGSRLTRLIYTPLDKAVYRLTRGRRGLSPPSTVLYLTTTGRKSGLPRRVPLMYLRDGDRYWVMASNFAQAHHPAWSVNLLSDPSATVQERGRTVEVTARLASRQEKEQLWPDLLEVYPAWRNYSEWTDRDFRLFCLEPR